MLSSINVIFCMDTTDIMMIPTQKQDNCLGLLRKSLNRDFILSPFNSAVFQKNMIEVNNNHSGLHQDICIARSSEKVCWTCFIMHMVSYELAPSLISREDRFLFQAILWKNTSQDSALTAPEWQAGKAMSHLCTGEAAAG